MMMPTEHALPQPCCLWDTSVLLLLIGTEAMVRERLRAWRDAGITTLRVYPAGDSLDERLAMLGRAIELVEELNREAR